MVFIMLNPMRAAWNTWFSISSRELEQLLGSLNNLYTCFYNAVVEFEELGPSFLLYGVPASPLTCLGLRFLDKVNLR